jgi:hypothetical protein
MPVESLGERSKNCTKPNCPGKFQTVIPTERHEFGQVTYIKIVCDTCGLVAWRYPNEPNSFATSV